MRTTGKVVLVVGCAMAAYALLLFDPTVSNGDGGRVNNIGLLQDRQNLLIAGCAALIAGVLMLVLGKPGASSDTAEQGREGNYPSPQPFGSAVLKDATTDAFQAAIERGDTVAVERLLDSGAVKAYGELPTGRGWLQYAVLSERVDACKLLIARGASVDHPDHIGSTARRLAKASHKPELIAVCDTAIPASVGPLEKAPVTKTTPATTQSPPMGIADQLERLAALQDRGMLTPDEFEKAKRRLLGA